MSSLSSQLHPDISIPEQASTLKSATLRSQSIDYSPDDRDECYVRSNSPRTTSALRSLRDSASQSKNDNRMLVSIAPADVDDSISLMSSLSPHEPKSADEHDPDISITAEASTMLRSLSIDQPRIGALSEAPHTASPMYSVLAAEVPSSRENLCSSAVIPIAPDDDDLISPASNMAFSLSPHEHESPTSISSANINDERNPNISIATQASARRPMPVDQPSIAYAVLSQARILADKEAATLIKPPPPPSDIVKGYNKQLDEPRPTTIQDYLRDFEVLFVIDDSGSMAGNRWKETRDALGDIAEYAFKLNVHTVSLRFLNNMTYVRGLQRKANVMSLFDKVQPDGWTPTGAVLKTVFGQHLDRVDAAVRKGESEYSKILPLDIIVLTDGMPSDRPADVVSQAVKRLRSSRYHPNTMGVQFVQIADEKLAKAVLKELVMGDNARIVDTVPYRGVVTSQKLQRILLGGLHPNIRSMLPVDMLAI